MATWRISAPGAAFGFTTASIVSAMQKISLPNGQSRIVAPGKAQRRGRREEGNWESLWFVIPSAARDLHFAPRKDKCGFLAPKPCARNYKSAYGSLDLANFSSAS